MILLKAANLLALESNQLDSDIVRAALVRVAESMLRCNVHFTPSEYCMMSTHEISALETARLRIDAEYVILSEFAHRGPVEAAETFAIIDGGLSRDQMLAGLLAEYGASKYGGSTVER